MKQEVGREPFFTKDRGFYRTLFRMFFENLVAYSVNMADNIMLGNYSQVCVNALEEFM